MNSKILNALGMKNIDPMIFVLVLLLVCIILLILIILQNGKIKKVTEKYEKFMRGKDMESMEELIMKRFDDMDKMLEDTEKNVNDIKTLFDNMKDTVQKAGVVKYDAFNEMGGKLSFAIALLDGKDSGFILNSMHSRDGCYNYVKEIVNGQSYIELSEEEAESLEKAMYQETFGLDLKNIKK